MSSNILLHICIKGEGAGIEVPEMVHAGISASPIRRKTEVFVAC